AACARAPGPKTPPPAPPALDGAAVAAAARASPLVARLPAALVEVGPALAADEASALVSFYAARDFAPVWFDGGAYAARREAFAASLAATTAAPAEPDTDDLAARADREVALSVAARRVAAEPRGHDPAAQRLAVAFAQAVADVAPPPPETPFGGHAAAIARYRTIVAAGGWPTLPLAETVAPGETAPGLDRLRRRLRITGDLTAASAGGERYDAALVEAVKRFQARHGLAVDGVLGPATRRALNLSARTRLAQLERAAAARARTVPRPGDRYVMVNLPAFALRYVRDGAVRHRAAVVVGSVDDPTPVFTDAIEYLVFNPNWHVPARIAREELVFDFKEDAAAMAARGFRLVDSTGGVADPTTVDWAAVEPAALPFRIRQGPGSGNALGRVKFMFPNAHAVYLHDTPSRHLFDRPARAFSHGCIRVRHPLTLAERLLEADGWARADLERWVRTGATRHVALTEPVPVHLVYVTAWGDAQGRVQFRRDIYGREPRATAAQQAPRQAPVRAGRRTSSPSSRRRCRRRCAASWTTPRPASPTGGGRCAIAARAAPRARGHGAREPDPAGGVDRRGPRLDRHRPRDADRTPPA
ncbi:MAG: murein L,D-transpeptidase, partial [Alphaproteobacteria bacterium]